MISRGYEKLFYVSSGKFDPSRSFDVEMAGITSPNENYRIERNRTRFSLNNVSVFEYVISGILSVRARSIPSRREISIISTAVTAINIGQIPRIRTLKYG